MDEKTFYQQLALRSNQVTHNHPIGDSLWLNPRFMPWWDSLSPQQRQVLEENIDARFMCLEEWKLECQR